MWCSTLSVSSSFIFLFFHIGGAVVNIQLMFLLSSILICSLISLNLKNVSWLMLLACISCKCILNAKNKKMRFHKIPIFIHYCSFRNYSLNATTPICQCHCAIFDFIHIFNKLFLVFTWLDPAISCVTFLVSKYLIFLLQCVMFHHAPLL